jgi:galactose mutarotase-like enzyme
VEAVEAPMPVIVGWHPWFARVLRDGAGRPVGGAIAVGVGGGAMLRRGPDGLPDGELVRPIPPGPWDDCFVDIPGEPGVHWPGGLEVRIASQAAFWVVYTGHPGGVCVEPQTGPPNGLNTGQCAIVRPGEPFLVSMSITWGRPG